MPYFTTLDVDSSFSKRVFLVLAVLLVVGALKCQLAPKDSGSGSE